MSAVGRHRARLRRMLSLPAPEIRVLACLIEKEAAVPDSYPMTLNALRLGCNQSTNRRPVVAYDDRTVEQALMSLKSVGLVRFVHPSHGGRTIRYRHVADERWHLSRGELLALSALALRGPQTTNEIAARIERLLPADEQTPVEALLDALAARSPEPLAARLERRPGDREPRWVATLGEQTVDPDVASLADDESYGDASAAIPRPSLAGQPVAGPSTGGPSGAGSSAVGASGASDQATADLVAALEVLTERVEQLGAVIGAVAGRVERLERDLGIGG